jgi:hypothetical protein
MIIFTFSLKLIISPENPFLPFPEGSKLISFARPEAGGYEENQNGSWFQAIRSLNLKNNSAKCLKRQRELYFIR